MKTKIIATLGPSSNDYETIRKLVETGVDGFRLNLVYGTLEEKKEIIGHIRKIEKELGLSIPIIVEIQGRTLRIGEMPVSPLQQKEKIIFKLGAEKSEDRHIVPVPYAIPPNVIKPKDKILLADGRIIVSVDKIEEDEIEGTVLRGGTLRTLARIAIQRKSILKLSPIISDDINKLKELIKHDIDAIMVPDVLSHEDIKIIKDVINQHKANDIRILARIENPEALPKIRSIARESDGIVIAKENIENMLADEERPIADMFLEDFIVRSTLQEGRPILIIPPTIESILTTPIMKRADIVSLSLVAEKGFDAIILCSETAIGEFPVESVKYVKKITSELESRVTPRKIDLEKCPLYIKFNHGLVMLSENIKAKISIFTTRGNTALAISRFRPKSIIYSFTNSIRTARYLNLVWGVEPLPIDSIPTFGEMKRILLEKGYIKKNDFVVFSIGWRPELGTKQSLLIEMIS